jgi:hypothetical protein
MILKVMGIEKVYIPNEVDIDEMFGLINTVLNEKNMVFSHLLVDGVEVYQNHYEYLKERISEIKEVEAAAKPRREYLKDVFSQTVLFIEEVIPQVRDIGKSFFQNSKSKSWNEIPGFIEVIEPLLHSFVSVSPLIEEGNNVQECNIWREYSACINALKDQLSCLCEAMQKNDTVVAGDTLVYEMAPLFKTMKHCVSCLIEDMG